jgi:hypothetical protein
MKKTNIILILVLSFNFLYAQKESNMWYFGWNTALDFNSGFPVDVTNNAMYSIEGSASISDSAGSLLFYSNGENVWDRNHMIMPNGDSLGGHQSATQAALIVPYPNNPNLYFLFTLQQQYTPPPTNFNFSYSIIDMSLNSGNGDVTVKNVIIRSPIAEKLAGVKHSNGTDVWVMVHGYGNGNDSLFAYLITSSGVSSSPVINKIGQSVFGLNSLGYMKFSSDGSKLAVACRLDNFIDLFDFDNSTGIVSNEKYLTLPPPYAATFGAYGLEFSASGNYLYATELLEGAVLQWDVTSNSDSIINSTLKLVGSPMNVDMGAMQLAPDGKIYVVAAFLKKLGVINYPELPGLLCNYVDSGIVLSHFNNIGLPNFIASNFLSVGINESILKSNISIFPNPFTSEISIAITKQNIKQGIFTIKNILGQTIFIKQENYLNNNYTKTIDLSFLSKGIYLLDVNIDGERTVKKIVKE